VLDVTLPPDNINQVLALQKVTEKLSSGPLMAVHMSLYFR